MGCAPNIASRGFRESIKGCGVVDQDGRARCRVWRPFRQQVEEDRIVRLFLLRRMRPVARPHHPLRRGFNVGAGNRHRVRVGRRADLAVLIGAGQLDPGLAFIDELVDRLEAGIVERVGLCETAEVIKHDIAFLIKSE